MRSETFEPVAGRPAGGIRVLPLEEPDPTAAFDGHEAQLRELFARPEREVGPEIEALLATAPDWLTQYHLSPQRRLLLSWCDFPADGTVLEVGAGCGALTGLLCDRAGRVLANEKFATRAEVIARRHADRENLTVLVGGIDRIRLDQPVDVLVCVGVLEYAGMFLAGDGDDRWPFERFLRIAHDLVRPAGGCFLATNTLHGPLRALPADRARPRSARRAAAPRDREPARRRVPRRCRGGPPASRSPRRGRGLRRLCRRADLHALRVVPAARGCGLHRRRPAAAAPWTTRCPSWSSARAPSAALASRLDSSVRLIPLAPAPDRR